MGIGMDRATATTLTATAGFGPSSPRVLLAEDDDTCRLVAAGILTKLGCAVDQALDGREAVEAARAHRYDIVFMDLQMPEMDGLAAAAAIRALGGQAPPVVGMSANICDDERDACLRAGMVACVAKPLRRPEFTELIQRWASPTPAPSPAADEPPVIDEEVIATLIDSLDEEVVGEVVQAFLTDGAGRVASFAPSLQAGDTRALERQLHALKGAAANLGFRRVVARCERAREAIREQAPAAETGRLVAAVAEAFVITRDAWLARADGRSHG